MTVATSNADLIRTGYERFAAQDIPGLLEALSPSITWTIAGTTIPTSGTYHGHDGILEFLQRVGQTWSRLELSVDTLIAEGDRVVVLGRYAGEGKGGTFDVAYAHAWVVEDGLAVSYQEYTDTEALARAAGV